MFSDTSVFEVVGIALSYVAGLVQIALNNTSC